LRRVFGEQERQVGTDVLCKPLLILSSHAFVEPAETELIEIAKDKTEYP
jgi:hypothetical protein